MGCKRSSANRDLDVHHRRQSCGESSAAPVIWLPSPEDVYSMPLLSDGAAKDFSNHVAQIHAESSILIDN